MKLKPDAMTFTSDRKEMVSFKELTSLLLSKDFEKYESYRQRYLDDGLLRFLDGESFLPGQKLILQF